MLTHWYKGTTGRFLVEHGGASLRVEIGRAHPHRYSEIGVRFGPATSFSLHLSERVRDLDGESWHRVEHGPGPMPDARCLWLRAGYSELGRDDRMLVLIDAPSEWRITWQDPPISPLGDRVRGRLGPLKGTAP